MAYITPIELIALLPQGTAVTRNEAQRFIQTAISRLNENFAPGSAPVDAETEGLVEQYAYARAIQRHYLKGEGAIEVPAADAALAAADRAMENYDERHTTIAENEAEAPRAYIEDLPYG